MPRAVPQGGGLQGQKEQAQWAEAVAEQKGADPQAVLGLGGGGPAGTGAPTGRRQPRRQGGTGALPRGK